MIFYFYKITNKINRKYYFGVHSTEDINDGYMGSGTVLAKAYKKYGIQNFEKQILKYFQNKQQMYQFEQQVVTLQQVNNKMCYNVVIGGKNAYTAKHLSQLAKQVSTSDQQVKLKRKKAVIQYWSTGDIQAKKKKISDGVKRYWSTGNVQEKKKRHSQIIKQNFQSGQLGKKLSQSLNKYWEQDGQRKRLQRSVSVKESKRHKDAIKNMVQSGLYKKGYENIDFVKRWKNIYQKNKEILCQLLKYSNLPQQFIVKKMFKLKIKTKRLLNYYIFMNYLPNPLRVENKFRFLRFDNVDKKGHKDGRSKKTFFSNQLKYNFMFYYQDFFQDFEKIKIIQKDDSISDSAILNFGYGGLKNYIQVIQYFQQIGIVKNVREQVVRVNKTSGNKKFTIPAIKTKFDVDYDNIKCIILNQEFEQYGIDDNGKAFCKGKFKLEIDGKECFL